MRISKRPIQRATSRRAALVGAALIGALVTGAIVLRSHGRDDRRPAIDPVSAKAVRTRPHAAVPRTLTSTAHGPARCAAPGCGRRLARRLPRDAARRADRCGHVDRRRERDLAQRRPRSRTPADRGARRGCGAARADRCTCSAEATARGSTTRSSASAAASSAGLPAPSSDQAAAAIGGTAYVVGGFTGTHWLDTIVAWSPGRGARIVAHLPSPVRYAAVTSAGGKLIVAGGSLPDGEASSRVFEYSPVERSASPRSDACPGRPRMQPRPSLAASRT